MNVFDFDHTIYRSDSTIDFYLFCIKRHPQLIRFLPGQLGSIFLYKLHRCSKEQMKEGFFSFLCGLKEIDSELELFACKNLYKMQKWYVDHAKDTDVVISASPRFIVEKFSEKSTGFAVIASEVDKNTGRFDSRNCHGEEKVRRFREVFTEGRIDEFYSDSDSDLPMARLAGEAYKVKKEKITRWAI